LGVLGFVLAALPFAISIGTSMGDDAIHGTNLTLSLEVPATVSELVSKWESVEARVFFGFEVAASFCILLSWYPFKLRYASCIPSHGGCRISMGCFGSVSWATWRQFVPPLGLLLVACVPTVKRDDWTMESMVLVLAHGGAAMMMFLGFLMAEAHTLSIWPFRCPCDVLEKGSKQYRLRLRSWMVAGVCFALFNCMLGLQHIAVAGWQFNVISFALEVVAGLAMLLNHFVIVVYSPERHWGNRGFKGRLNTKSSKDDPAQSSREAGDRAREEQRLAPESESLSASSSSVRMTVVDSRFSSIPVWDEAVLES